MLNELKTVKQLKDLIKNLDDDFKIEMKIFYHLTEKELKNSDYPYPFGRINESLKVADVEYSDKTLSFEVAVPSKYKIVRNEK